MSSIPSPTQSALVSTLNLIKHGTSRADLERHWLPWRDGMAVSLYGQWARAPAAGRLNLWIAMHDAAALVNAQGPAALPSKYQMQKWLSLTEKATSAQWGGPNAALLNLELQPANGRPQPLEPRTADPHTQRNSNSSQRSLAKARPAQITHRSALLHGTTKGEWEDMYARVGY